MWIEKKSVYVTDVTPITLNSSPRTPVPEATPSFKSHVQISNHTDAVVGLNV